MLIGLVILCGVMLFSGVMLARTPSPTPTAYLSAYGFCATVGMQLLAMLRTENGLRVTRHDIKSTLQPIVSNTEAVVHKLENGGAPLTRHDLEEMLPAMVEKIVNEMCERRGCPAREAKQP